MIRLALILVLLLPVAAEAAVPPALGPDGRVYPLVGGGTETPREGLPATRARVSHLSALTTMADGSVALLAVTRDALVGQAFAVGRDGRIRMLPEPPVEGDDADAFEGAPDGALLVLGGGRLWRLAPGAAAWAELVRPAGIPSSFLPNGVIGLPDGYALLGRRATWWVRRGVAASVDHPAASGSGTRTPDGTLVRALEARDELVALTPGAPVRTLRPPTPGGIPIGRVMALPGGGFVALRAPGRPEILAADGRQEAVLHPRARLGTGFGGPFASTDEFPVAVAPDAALPTIGRPGPLGIAVPPGSARSLAAVAPATYSGLRRGEVTVSTTFAGSATIEVRSGGEVVASATVAVTPGETAVALPAAPPPGRYVVALRLTAADGREAWHRMPVLTLARLSRADAERAMRRYAHRSRLGRALRVDLRRCDRASATTFRCQAVQVTRRRNRPDRERCVGVWTARLRPDGVRSATREAPRSCRRLGPLR